MIRINSLATVIALMAVSVSYGQISQSPINDQWIRPITFEVSEAIGSGVKPAAAPTPETAQFVGAGPYYDANKGGVGDASQKAVGKGKGAYPYTWTTRLGMLFMDRTNHNLPYLVDTAAGNAPLLASEMGASIGFKTNIIRHHEGQRDRELGFLGLFSDSGLNFSVVDDDFIMPTTPNLSIIADGVALNSYNSSLIGIEYNFRQRHDHITTLAGFRWLSLDEDFLYTITAPGGPQVIGGQTETTNNLFGFQLGMEGVIVQRGCVHLEGGMKAGAYWNMAEHNTTLAGVPAPGVIIVDDNDDHLAFEGEVDFTGVCRLNETWNFRLGYQFLWLEGVVLAPDQISSINLVTSSGMNTEGSPFYHGALVQFEGRY